MLSFSARPHRLAWSRTAGFQSVNRGSNPRGAAMKVLYPPELKAEAKKLRLEGYSYTQIRRTLGLKSKGTLSLWLKDLELTAEAEQKLKSNQHLAEARGLKDSNRARSLRIREENHEQYLLGFESMKHFGARSGISASKFYIIRQISKSSTRSRRNLPYGTAVIRVSDRKLLHRLLGMIDGIAAFYIDEK